MQVRLFSIPVLGGEALEEDMNRFLRSQKILKVEQSLTGEGDQAIWCFCIKYLSSPSARIKSGGNQNRIDYKEELDEEAFARYLHYRGIRKQIAEEEAKPAYAIFTNAELAELARLPELTKASMKTVKGIGDKKIASYGKYFISEESNEKNRESETGDR